jgi:hypothetical protein
LEGIGASELNDKEDDELRGEHNQNHNLLEVGSNLKSNHQIHQIDPPLNLFINV